jgi:SAM-dependent methyltransferase
MSDPAIVFDRRAVRRHRDRAAATIDTVKDVLADLAGRLLDRLDDTTRRFSFALDIGGRGIIAPLLRARGVGTVSCDLSERMVRSDPGLSVVADEEWLPFAPGSFDLVVASMSLHWINDLPGALIQIRRVLRPGGLFLASLPVLGTLHELRGALTEAETCLSGGAAPRISPFPDLRDCAGLLQRAGFDLPVTDVEDLLFLYTDPTAILSDLRAAGEGNALALRSKVLPPRDLFVSALAGLPTVEGRIGVRLRFGVMTGWAPAA